MKKVLVLSSLVFSAFLGSCASNPVAKQDNQIGASVRGDWKLSSVNYRGLKSTVAIKKVFGIAKPECYVNSTWSLNQNSKKGSYIINNSDSECPLSKADIIWNIVLKGENSFFTFKDVTGIKAKQNTSGYQLRIESLNETSMELVQDVDNGGKVISIVYTFVK